MARTSLSKQQGLTYLWMLLAVFLVGLLLGRCLDVESTLRQRTRETELLYVGDQYRAAIRQYYESSPGYRHDYPGSLRDLLADPRYIGLHRYLRQLYPDPVTDQSWVEIPAPGGGIMGVRSSSEATPIKQAGFAAVDVVFEKSAHYSDWRFVYEPPAVTKLQGTTR